MSDSSSGQVPTRTAPAAQQQPAKTSQPEFQVPPVPPDVLEAILRKQGLPPAKAGIVIEQITEIQRLHSGPLPTVEDYQGYENVCPGAARDILDMAIRQQRHHNAIEKMAVVGDFLLPVIGIIAALAVIGALLYAGVYLAVKGFEGLSLAVLSGTGIATVAGAFLQKKRSKKPDEPKAAAPKNKGRKK